MVFTNSEVVNTENSEAFIYPNPATDHFSIKFPTSKFFSATLIIKSSSGVKFLHQKIETGDAVVDIAGFPEGLYFIEVVSEDYRKVFKLVKQ